MNLESEIKGSLGYPGCGRSTQNDPLLPPCVSLTHQESYKTPGLKPSVGPFPSDHALSCWLLTPLYLVDDRTSRNSELLLIRLWYLAFGSTLKNIRTQAAGKSKWIPAGLSAQWSPETPNQARARTLHQTRSKNGKNIFNLTSMQTQSVLLSQVVRAAFRAGTFRVAEWHPRKWRIPVQTEEGFISRAPLCCCHCLSLLCFHLSALGRKREGNTFRMEETSQTECRLSKLKMYLCQSLPSYCHFYFPSLSLSLSAPSRLKLHLKFCFCKSLAWCEVKLGAGLMRMAAVSGYLVNNVKSCDDALTLTLILLFF